RLPLFMLATGLLVACGVSSDNAQSPPGVEALEQPVRVPGRWAPPADSIAIANAQFVPVVDPPPVNPGGRCAGPDLLRDWCQHPACTQAHPGTTEIAEYILRRWPTTINSGVYGCRRNTNNGGFLSVHAVGRAIDISVPLAGGDSDNTLGDEIANWLMTNAEHIGVQRVGWDGMWFNGERGFGSRMCQRQCGDNDYPQGCWPCNPHVDHLHIEVSVDAAYRNTRFFSQGPPGERCPIVCYGNAAVDEDCSFVDCAAQGQVCMPDPVRCANAEPPEQPAAIHAPAAAMPALTPIGPPVRFEFVGPARVFDTRPDGDDARLIRPEAGPLAAGVVATVTDFPAVADDARGVWLNLAAVRPAARGFVQVYPSGPQPQTSTLNFEAGSVRSNGAPVVFGQGGGVDFTAVTDVHVVADVFAAFTDDGLGLRSIAPRRVIDTRDTPEFVPAMTPVVVNVGGPDGARGVIASVAVINADAGFVRAYACDDPMPETSTLNYEGTGVVANTVVSRISAAGTLCLWSTQPVELIVDVTGYFVPDGELSYQPVRPVRLLDTRADDGLYQGRLGDGQIIELPIQGLAGAPAGIQAAVVNLVSVQSDEAGFLTMYPCGFDAPLASALNFGAGRAVVGTVTQSSIGDGKLCLRGRNRTHLIVDLLGVWVPTPGAGMPSESDPPNDVDPAIPADPDMGADDMGVDDMGRQIAGDAGAGADADADADAMTRDAGPVVDARVDAGDAPAPSGMVEGRGTSSGCMAAPGDTASPLLLLLGLALTRRRRR
ncbi:MAG: hypothetical protein ACI9U2_004398, partial [Bradymonadia bacterium]